MEIACDSIDKLINIEMRRLMRDIVERTLDAPRVRTS
jgi:hypothetical protein